jgi:hypothetical protein
MIASMTSLLTQRNGLNRRCFASWLALWFGWVGSGCGFANPIFISLPVEDESYIAREQLLVEFMPDVAGIRGEFQIRPRSSEPLVDPQGMAAVDLPIWVPKNRPANSPLGRWMNEFRPNEDIIFGSKSLERFRNLFGLETRLGGKLIPLRQISLNHFRSADNRQNIGQRAGLVNPDWDCLVVRFEFPHKSELYANTWTVSYRQPLSVRDGRKDFYYVPYFDGLPEERLLDDSRRYRIVLRPPGGGQLNVRHGRSDWEVPAGMVLPLRPRVDQPIQAEVVFPMPPNSKPGI